MTTASGAALLELDIFLRFKVVRNDSMRRSRGCKAGNFNKERHLGGGDNRVIREQKLIFVYLQ